MKTRLTDLDYHLAAEALGCEVAAIQAVVRVEAAGAGFLPDGRPKVLFERHWFRRLTGGRFDAGHPSLSNVEPGGYAYGRTAEARGLAEWIRLEEAIRLDRTAALQSASWGLPQIMGFNHALCGVNLETFVQQMRESETAQLSLMVEFLLNRGLADELQRLDWAGFARIYNGPAYRRNRYDEQLAEAYNKFKGH